MLPRLPVSRKMKQDQGLAQSLTAAESTSSGRDSTIPVPSHRATHRLRGSTPTQTRSFFKMLNQILTLKHAQTLQKKILEQSYIKDGKQSERKGYNAKQQSSCFDHNSILGPLYLLTDLRVFKVNKPQLHVIISIVLALEQGTALSHRFMMIILVI